VNCAIAKGPNNARSLSAKLIFGIGDANQQEGDRKRLLEIYKQAEQNEATSAQIQYRLGAQALILGENDRAQNAFTRALQLSPGYTAPYSKMTGLGKIRSWRNQFKNKHCDVFTSAVYPSVFVSTDDKQKTQGTGRTKEPIEPSPFIAAQVSERPGSFTVTDKLLSNFVMTVSPVSYWRLISGSGPIGSNRVSPGQNVVHLASGAWFG